MRKSLFHAWIPALLTLSLLLSACTAQEVTLTPGATPTDPEPADMPTSEQRQLQFIEFYSPL